HIRAMSSALVAGLRQPVELKRIILRAWRWWSGYFWEALGYATPELLRERILEVGISMPSDGDGVTVRFGPHVFALSSLSDEKDLDAYREQIGAAARKLRVDRVLGTLRLSPHLFLCKRISLPAAARDAL